ncbi:zinc-dependent alcohol dehydrogenase family protein [Nakamurella leprariae]|uniref:enoyl-[acyl-carrier-protein] reductase n=1 Tax=Nakamurella leprariae TaxID=2803911 RepID=A0A939BXZ6_9ACTN|nr:zinc-dependent alcohol dehydrogenase family protein [Nakamurella leprariae]MBM9469058.1 zinc-dependent alcohol dehydrogenase family protein [Nakamurella leprariae]
MSAAVPDTVPDTMRQVVQRRYGRPAEVAEIDTVPVPVPRDGQLLVRLEAAPINPAEILMFEGRYGYGPSKPALPRKAGIEGVGTVVGGATDVVPEGTTVALLGVDGLWSDYMVIPAATAIRLPPDTDKVQLALGMVNPQAVILLLEEHVKLQPGDWIVQNAGNSAFGRILDTVAHERGHKVVNVVRSQQAADSVAGRLTGPVVIDGPDLQQQVEAITGGELAVLGVDAVGGAATNRLAHCLKAGAVVSNYGLMSGEPCQIDSELVVFNDIRLEGYWTPRSMRTLTSEQIGAVFTEAFDLVISGKFDIPVEQTYSLSDVGAALEHAERGGRGGKIVLTR